MWYISTGREVRTARTRRAPGRGVLETEIRGEAASVDGRTRGLAAEGEGVAHDLLPEFRCHFSESPQIRIEALHEVDRPKGNLEGRSAGRRNLGNKPLRPEVLRAHAERRGQRRGDLGFGSERPFDLRPAV